MSGDYDNIPTELRDRRQWMLWDPSAATDRRPFGWNDVTQTLDKSGSWKEPTDWLTFEEACDAAATKESYGIGFVFRQAGDYIPMDVDGCYDENGELKDWVPDLDRFAHETYIEYSPSGTGLHILVKHPQLPPWWTDVHFTAEEHEGMEAYENKFFTVTGNQHETSLDTIEAVNPDGFLWNAYTAITGDTPTRDTNGGSDSSDGYTGDSGASETIDVSVYDLLSKSSYPEDKRRPHPYHGSGTGSNFHVDRGGETFRCWRHSITGNGLHLLGMQEGIIDCGDWSSSLSDATWTEIFDAARENGLAVPAKQSQQPAATADGGTSAVNTQGSSAEETGADAENDVWGTVRADYATDDREDNKRAMNRAVQQATDDFDLLTHEESEELYAFDPDTGIYRRHADHRIQEYLQADHRLAVAFYPTRANNIIKTLGYLHYTPEDDFGGPQNHICVTNGVLRIDGDSITLLDHSHTHHFLSSLDTEYDPDAEHPRFSAFLDEVLTSDQARMKLQEFAGYCLMHGELPYHKALFLVGPTASGKSTFLDTITAMLGDETVSHLSPQQLTGERFAPAEIYDKWANIRNDIPETLIENTGTFKEIVAGDPLKAEKKYKNPFYFNPTAKHLFSANQLPDAETDDEAFYRRILLCPFPDTIPVEDRDPDLDETLQGELPGVLNWALEGLQRLQEQRKFTGDRSPGETQRTWELWGHAIDRFAEDCLEEAYGTNIPTFVGYKTFVEYCHEHNVPSTTQHKMTRRLREENEIKSGRAYFDGNRQRCLKDVQFTPTAEDLRNRWRDGQ